MGRALLFALGALLGALLVSGQPSAGAPESTPCSQPRDCAKDEACIGLDACGEGVCGPAFSMPVFPIQSEGIDPYTVPIFGVMDHTGPFYQRCCDDDITAFSGERAGRNPFALFCPVEPEAFPACYFADCQCGFRSEAGEAFALNGSYFSNYLHYAGHAGFDYIFPFGTPLVATGDGQLCKALEDPVNGAFLSAWDRFHTFYIDHGLHGGSGYSSWYLHADDLAGNDADGLPLARLEPGECAPVARGQLVATVGNAGTVVPHLHFEMRRHPEGSHPESLVANVIDPYGWQGEGPDPWSDPTNNPQAESQIAPLWVACGNGRVDCGEDCDDGNLRSKDGCSAGCEAEPVPLEPAGSRLPEALVVCAIVGLAGWRLRGPRRAA